MNDIGELIMVVLGGIITVAIVSVIVGKKSQAPQAIQSIGSSVANVIAAAVNPVSAAYGYGNGAQTATSPSSSGLSLPSLPALSSFSSSLGL
jgi:hypothetical protein